MKILRLFVLCVVLQIFAGGCTIKYVSSPGKENAINSIGLCQDVIEQKIKTLSYRLQQKGLSDKNRELTENLLGFYRHLKHISSNKYVSENQYRYIIREMFKETDTLEQDYFFLLDTYRQDSARTVSAFVAMKQEILRLYRKKDYEGVVKKCLETRALFGPDAITPELGACLALSLSEKGLTDEAIRVACNSFVKLERYPDIVLLETNLALWQMQAGRQRQAFYVTQRISDICQQRRDMLQRLRQEQMSYRGPRSKVGGRVFDADNRSGNKRDRFSEINRKFPKVAELVKEHRFNDARTLLSRKKGLSAMNGIEAIDRAMILVDFAEKAYIKTRLKQAVSFLEQEKFDSALACIKDLESRHLANSEAVAIKRQASAGSINRERKRAAKLFLMARKSVDPAQKKAFLRSAYSILDALTKKYPFSPLMKKVRANMHVVSKELSMLE